MEVEELAARFTSELENLQGDERSFAAEAEKHDRLFDSIGRLMEKLEKNKIQSGSLVRALRSYLVGQYAGSNCTDNRLLSSSNSLPAVIVDFNQMFAARLNKAQLRR